MSQLGSVTFTVLNAGAPLGDRGMQVNIVTRAGKNGNEYQQVGLRPSDDVYSGLMTYSSAANLKTGKRTLLALKGEATTLTDGLGNSYNVFVKDIRFGRERVAAMQTGGNGKWLLDVTLYLEIRSF